MSDYSRRTDVVTRRHINEVTGELMEIDLSPEQAAMVEMGLGFSDYTDDVYPGEHEPLVSPEVWDEAARLREALARSKGGGRGRPPKGKMVTKQVLFEDHFAEERWCAGWLPR